MANTTSNTKRIEIFPYFDGVNTIVESHLAQPQELSHAENARSKKIGSIEKREGTRRLGNLISSVGNYGLFHFDNTTATNTGFYRISTVAGNNAIYYLNTSATWTTLSTGGIWLTTAQMSVTQAEDCLFIVNGTDNNRYITEDGATIVVSSDAAAGNHLYGSPIAYKINYYKDRLYLADIKIGSRRLKNTVMMSSYPVGIVSLVDGDYTAPVTSLKVTELKYIRSSDSLDVYRGGTKIGTITVSAKDASSNTITISTFNTDILSSDEIWVANTYDGTSPKTFRWADNPSSGINVKQYDTFKISGGRNDHITMMANVGDYQMFGNSNNLAIWNGSSLKNLDLGIGCVSDNGYVVALGTLWFVHYTGIYKTDGSMPQLLSSKVQRYIDGATKAGLEASAVGRKGTSVFFAIGDVTLYHADGSTEKTLSDVCLEYDVRQQNWYVHTNINATQFATYFGAVDPDRLEYASADTNCPVMEFLRDSVDDSQTTNKEISFRIDSNDITLNKSFEKICQPQRVIVDASRGSGIKVFVSLDGGRFYELEGEAIKGCVVLPVTNKDGDNDQPPRCRKIKISIRDSSTKLCKINKVALEYVETDESEDVKIETHEQ
jgi:hypothetical protein